MSNPIKAEWTSPDGQHRLILGDCLEILQTLEPGSVDAILADPPYSSGGFTRSDRTADPSEKYVQTGVEIIRHSFSGDNRDGRSWCYWSALWISAGYRAVRMGGKCLMFCDWRQLPLASDAIQAGGFVWRGIIAWDKGQGARAPHTGYHRHQCEYVVWGTVGVSVPDSHGGPWPGCYQIPVLQSDKHHLTGKPTELMLQLVETFPQDAVILDPFAGSFTVAVACSRTGRRSISIEIEERYFRIGIDRMERELKRHPLLEPVRHVQKSLL